MDRIFIFACLIVLFLGCSTTKKNIVQDEPQNANRETPLEIAARTGNTEVLEEPNRNPLEALDPESYFIVYGDAADPLINAIQAQDPAKISGLLKSGMDVNASDDYGNTALMYAVHNNNISIVRMLLQEYRAITDKGNKYGQKAIHVAVTDGSLPMFDVLRQFGADLNARDNAGNMPLAIAVYSRNTPMVEQLLINGANSKIRLKNDVTILAYAYAINDREMAHVIEEKSR
jgi:ankyrin repeat protein